jgi:hypothetical protein
MEVKPFPDAWSEFARCDSDMPAILGLVHVKRFCFFGSLGFASSPATNYQLLLRPRFY